MPLPSGRIRVSKLDSADKTLEFPPVRARKIRLHVLKAKRPININEFQIFPPEKKP